MIRNGTSNFKRPNSYMFRILLVHSLLYTINVLPDDGPVRYET